MNSSPTCSQPTYGLPDQAPNAPFRFAYDATPASTSSSSDVARSSNKKAPGRQITRNRASYSCHTCRRRKVKCDKIHPICGNCLKNGTECIYDVGRHKDVVSHDDGDQDTHGVKRRREAPPQIKNEMEDIQSMYGRLKQAGPTEQKSIEARLDKLTSMIERLSKTPQPLDSAEREVLAHNGNLDAPKIDTRPINGPTGNITIDSPRRTVDSSGDEFPIPSGLATDLVDPVGSLNLGHLSLEDGGRSRYVGTTYWAYISHEINELNQLLRDQNRSHDDPVGPEAYVEEAMGTAPVRQWIPSVDSPSELVGDRLSRGATFQKSVLFPSSESPSVNDKLVEPDMLDFMPTKRQSHILYQGFMSGIQAISPVVHPPTILKQYNAFWDWYDSSSYSGEHCPNPSFIPLLYAIWYGGSVTISIRTVKAEFSVSTRAALSKTYNDQVTRWLTKISFPRSPSLQGLAAYLLVQTILSKEEEPLTSSLFVSLAMRVAQTMGLHRDPANFGIHPCEAECRRRMWWHIVHMDGVVSMSSGLPPLVSEEYFWDVRETSEVKDTLLGLPQAEQYERMVRAGMRPRDNPDDPTVCGGPSMVNVYYLTARGKYVMARAVRRIMKIQLGTKPVTRRDMEELRSILVDLQAHLNSIVNRIPEAVNFQASPESTNRSWSLSKSPAETRVSDTALPGEKTPSCTEQYHNLVLISFHKWARILLSLFIDKAFCVAYQPFLKNAKSRIWPAARQSALRHCHGFMEKFISLATDPDFQPFQWSWPGNHQPMHATMIMLIDLYERPYSLEAPKSRAFIDRIFSLTGPDGGVVGGEDGITTQRPLKDGGREAWDMIRRLRHKAWQKAGLDPQKLWTEQAQIQAGVASVPDEYATNSDYAPQTPSIAESPAAPSPIASRDQLADFSKMFYNMTRSQVLPNTPSLAATRPSPLRYEVTPSTDPSTSSTSTGASQMISPSNFSRSSTSSINTSMLTGSTTSTAPSIASAPPAPPALNPDMPFTQPPVTTPQTPLPFMDTAAISPTTQVQPPLNVPTPPSMVDPNLNFDWDQWDAVFGQHLPVSDELMELDSLAGFEFGDLGSGRGIPSQSASLNGAEVGMTDVVPGTNWTGYP